MGAFRVWERVLRIIVTGATGFIGRALTHRLVARGDTVTAVTRGVTHARSILPDSVAITDWSEDNGAWREDIINQTDAVINLAGEPVAEKRWSDRQKLAIHNSRVRSTERLIEAMSKASSRPHVLVSGSAIGYYGPRGDGILSEESSPGNDFLAGVCKDWERVAQSAENLGVRVAVIRTGIILGTSGGALPRMLTPFKLFGGGVLGPKDQWISWIHLDDEVGLILHALENEGASGPINSTAPNPMRMDEFSHALGRAMHRPVWAPGLPLAMRLVLGERAEVVFASQRVQPRRAEQLGYQFSYSRADEALRALLVGT